MIYSSRKKIFILVITVVLFFLSQGLFFQVERMKREQYLSEKIELLKDEQFQLCILDASVDTQTKQAVEIEWWFQEEKGIYYFFVPKALNDRLCYIFNQYDFILIDGEEVRPGDPFHMQEGSHEVSLASGEVIPVEVMFSENVNSMFIQTDLDDLTGIHESKQNFDTGSYILLDSDGKVNCTGRLDSIKGRGNVTFDGSEKKPYSIRMQNKTAVLDLGIGKGWNLIANAFDDSLIRNQLVTELAKAMNMEYVPDMAYVDLYINGEYRGNYQITEKVEISEERLNIRNLQNEMEILNPESDFDMLTPIEEPVDNFESVKWVEGLQTPQNIDSGYLLELDMTYRYYEEQSGFISSRKQAVVIKSPQCVSFEQAYYVANKYQDMEDALCADDGYNEATGLYYSDYMDLYSFAQKYLVEEITKNMDAAVTSFYMYIPENDTKFYAGPIWDYDRTFGTEFERGGIDLKDPASLYVSENIYFEQADINFFYELCKQEEFKKMYATMYFDDVREHVLELSEEIAPKTVEMIESSAMMDAVRNQSLGADMDVEENREAFYQYNEKIQNFIRDRVTFLDEEWSKYR